MSSSSSSSCASTVPAPPPPPPPIVTKQSAGVLPMYNDQLVLVTKLHSGEHLIFPKGKIERGEESHEAAAREALEEAGLVGETTREPFVRVHHINFHAMRVRDMREQFLEADQRMRVCMTPQEALESARVVDYVKSVIREARNHSLIL